VRHCTAAPATLSTTSCPPLLLGAGLTPATGLCSHAHNRCACGRSAASSNLAPASLQLKAQHHTLHSCWQVPSAHQPTGTVLRAFPCQCHPLNATRFLLLLLLHCRRLLLVLPGLILQMQLLHACPARQINELLPSCMMHVPAAAGWVSEPGWGTVQSMLEHLGPHNHSGRMCSVC